MSRRLPPDLAHSRNIPPPKTNNSASRVTPPPTSVVSALAGELHGSPTAVTPPHTVLINDVTTSSISPFDAYHLPSPIPMAAPSFVWAKKDAESFTNSLNAAYIKVVKWKPNIFSFPLGNTGKNFVQELSRLLRAYAERSVRLGICSSESHHGEVNTTLTKTRLQFQTQRQLLISGAAFTNLASRGHQQIGP